MSCGPSLLFGWVLVKVVVPEQGERGAERDRKAQDGCEKQKQERGTSGKVSR